MRFSRASHHPDDMTPLNVPPLYEAVGRPMPTRNLPRAFAMADLAGHLWLEGRA